MANEVKYLDLAGARKIVQAIDAKLETKVNVETGKGLSTNDYTTAEKQALAKVIQDVEGIVSVGGQANVIETVKVDGVALVPDEAKAVNIDLSKFALKSEIVNAMYWRGTVADVASLPTDAAVGDIYHVTATGGEHAWDGSAWQELGSILDLSAYSTTEQVNALISGAIAPKADKTYVDEQLALKADKSTTYTKTEVDGLVSPKADKTYVDEELAKKAVAATTYTKTEVDGLVSPKADKSYVDTELGKKAVKSDVDTALAGKADKVHSHEIGEVNGLQDALNLKANVADFVAITDAEIDALFA